LFEHEGVVVEEAACNGEIWTSGYEFKGGEGGCEGGQEGNGADSGRVEEEGGEDGQE